MSEEDEGRRADRAERDAENFYNELQGAISQVHLLQDELAGIYGCEDCYICDKHADYAGEENETKSS